MQKVKSLLNTKIIFKYHIVNYFIKHFSDNQNLRKQTPGPKEGVAPRNQSHFTTFLKNHFLLKG